MPRRTFCFLFLSFMTDGSFRKDRRNLTSMLVQPISTKLAKELLSAPSDGHSQPCVPMKMAPSSGQRIINLSIGSQTSYRRVFNVIGYLRGKINPDKYVLVGARHSSWYEGGLADWSSGAAVISQIIDSLTAQTSAHWQPDRTIVFCSMGGSALGNVGSFEWGEVGCELEEKERFWSELDEVMESIPTGDEEVMGKFGVKERNLEGQMVVDFAKRMDMAVVNTYFQKREEHRVTYKSGGRRTQVVLPDDWETTAEVIRETGRKVLGVSSGRRKEDMETWWWNEEVQDSIQRKRLAKKKWDMDRTEENRQEYKELQRRVKREVSKAKQKAYDKLYTRLDTREGEKDLYRKSTTDAIFALRILMEKYRDGQRELHCVFVDLEKAYDRVPREELWYCMRKSGVAEKYVRVVQDMYERIRTVVRCAVGQTEEFKVEVGLHQGSALSPFLFAMVMDQLSEEVRQESPWTMMFADDIVICSESREQVEENLERWRFALERRGMKVSCSKTEYMCVNEREGSGTVRLQGEEVKKVQEFKYLGSTVQSNGECGKEANKVVLENTVVAYVSLHNPVRAYGPQSSASPSLLQLASDIHKKTGSDSENHFQDISFILLSCGSLYYDGDDDDNVDDDGDVGDDDGDVGYDDDCGDNDDVDNVDDDDGDDVGDDDDDDCGDGDDDVDNDDDDDGEDDDDDDDVDNVGDDDDDVGDDENVDVGDDGDDDDDCGDGDDDDDDDDDDDVDNVGDDDDDVGDDENVDVGDDGDDDDDCGDGDDDDDDDNKHIKSCLHAGGCPGLNISTLQSPAVMDFFTSQLAAPLVEFASSANPAESARFLSEAFFPFESSLAETLDPAFRLHETVAKIGGCPDIPRLPSCVRPKRGEASHLIHHC
ncbi:hypothetical protein QTP70_034999 [Hemibagrus guttatus]|uniref:ribonuclease H n=1 Tax=Hemibagrus guttatus TaxID=175788 RepID=A0AAE0QX49_9TELE|nr:hypothetical protein QTP70_034999 [Hemibagrus guttatus]